MNEVERNMSQIMNILSKNGIKYTDKISTDTHSNFGKSLNVYSDQINADLIMIMTNPHQLLPSFILSPWAEQVIFNLSKIPAMCINPIEFGITYVGL
jgi:hypothetical protein